MAKKKSANKKPLPPLGAMLLATESDIVRKRMIAGLAILCALLFIADLFHLRHGKFEMEDIPGFYGFFGFAAFAFIIFATKLLKHLLSRPENYYGDSGVESEDYPDEDLGVKEHGDD